MFFKDNFLYIVATAAARFLLDLKKSLMFYPSCAKGYKV